MSFYTSLSGLQAAQTNMSTISHNLANVATNGFKKARAEFADVMPTSVSQSPNQQIGAGTVTKGIRQQFGQGVLTQSSSSLDMAITGDGFFAVRSDAPNSDVSFTRNGSFLIDANGFITDAQSNRLLGYPLGADGDAAVTTLADAINLRVPEKSTDAPATTEVRQALTLPSGATTPAVPFDRTDASSYNAMTTTTAYDTNGNPVTLNNYFVRQSDAAGAPTNNWSVYTFAGDTQLGTNPSDPQPSTLSFDVNGDLARDSRSIQLGAFTPGGTTPTQEITLNFADTQQLASSFSVQTNTQNGTSVGELSGVTVNSSGLVVASFSNGEAREIGQVVVAKFNNPTGLKQVGNSSWLATGLSGSANLGEANENGFGSVMSGMIEGSNVDITEELVGLIAAQRNFQANAKALDTASQISQSIFNIRT